MKTGQIVALLGALVICFLIVTHPICVAILFLCFVLYKIR